MKSIKTEYKGFMFRSKLEATWALFFDFIEVDWDYEPEGFELDNGEWYLPDFYIHNWEIYIEIKYKNYEDEKIREKMMEFRNSGDGNAILLIKGYPWNMDAIIYCFDQCDSSGGICESYITGLGTDGMNTLDRIDRTYYSDLMFQKDIPIKPSREDNLDAFRSCIPSYIKQYKFHK